MIYSDKYNDSINAREYISANTAETALDAEFGEYHISRKNEFGPYHYASTFDLEHEFMTEKGYVSKMVNNTYNDESDLDANIRYQIWVHKSVKGNDYIHANDDVTEEGLPAMVISIAYNYADPREGYDGPELKIPQFSDGEYAYPTNITIGYFFTADDAENVDAVAYANKLNDYGHYQAGYYGSPYYHLESDADSLERDENGKITVIFEGHTLIAHTETPY
jgi:hypothetical protein